MRPSERSNLETSGARRSFGDSMGQRGTRGPDGGVRRLVGLLARLTVRQKIVLFLAVAGLLPVVAAGFAASTLVFRSFDTAARDQTDRALRTALNLVLRQVQAAGKEAVRLAETSDLEALLQANDARGLDMLLAAKEEHLPLGLVEIMDGTGRLVASRAAGGSAGAQPGLNRAMPPAYRAYRPARHRPGMKAPAYMSPTDLPNWSAITISTSEGGMICASVPEAAITPVAKRRS